MPGVCFVHWPFKRYVYWQWVRHISIVNIVGVLFSPMVGGRAGGGKKFSETVRCRKFIRGRDIG